MNESGPTHKRRLRRGWISRLPIACTLLNLIAGGYVLIDDKLRILAVVRKVWGDRLTTVFPKQGHYAMNAAEVAKYPPADITVDRIGELLRFDRNSLIGSSRQR